MQLTLQGQLHTCLHRKVLHGHAQVVLVLIAGSVCHASLPTDEVNSF
jgi:hypothetical protein